MVVDQVLSDAEVDRIFQALADATRRDIVNRVLREQQSVSALARQYPMSFAAVQKHVAVLERAGLVSKERRGREQLVTGKPDTVNRAIALLETYEEIWRQRVNSIDNLLAAGTHDGDKTHQREDQDDAGH